MSRLTLFKTTVLLACLLLSGPSGVVAQSAKKTSGALPSLGDDSELAAAAERRIGQRIAASIYRDPDYIDDPVLADYLQSIWQPLMAASRARGDITPELDERFAWELFLIRDRSINAFALPGGYLGVHLGLISAVSNRDELAAVLGHELSHVTQRHISRLISQQGKSTPWMVGAMILGALAASKSPQAGAALITGGQAAALQSQLNFSRDMEREADRVGLNVMTEAGFEARGVSSMFEKLQQASRFDDNGSFPYLRSHPLSTERIAAVQARLQLAATETAPATPAKRNALVQALTLHGMMAARAKVLTEPGVDALRAMARNAQTARSQRSGSGSGFAVDPGLGGAAASLYGGALAAAKLRDFSLADALISQMTVIPLSDPDVRRTVSLLQLEVDLMAGRLPTNATNRDLSQTAQRAELLLGCQALLAAGNPQAVINRLPTWVADHPGDSSAWQLLATAFGSQGQTVRAIRADAEAQVARLDYPAALDRLKAAQNMLRNNPATGDFMESSIIDTRARQVESLVREQALQDKLDR